MQELETEIGDKSRKIKEYEEKILYANKMQEELKNKLENKTAELNRINKEWEMYKNDTERAMEQFIKQINRQTLNVASANSISKSQQNVTTSITT